MFVLHFHIYYHTLRLTYVVEHHRSQYKLSYPQCHWTLSPPPRPPSDSTTDSAGALFNLETLFNVFTRTFQYYYQPQQRQQHKESHAHDLSLNAHTHALNASHTATTLSSTSTHPRPIHLPPPINPHSRSHPPSDSPPSSYPVLAVGMGLPMTQAELRSAALNAGAC